MASNGIPFRVNVHIQGQELMKFTAQKDDRVKKINEEISSKTKVPVENQKLLLGSEALNPEKKLSDYWLDPTTTIHLTLKVVKPSDVELKMFVVEVDKGKKHPIHIQPSISVSQVKKTIEEITTVPPMVQTLYFNGRKLEDGKSMSDYFIQPVNNNSNIYINPHINININLFSTKWCIGG